ncbi:MAG: Bacterial regulatory proteins, gntR family [Lentisphaerae bacterium ADurb.Bin242]|nr:MAG: Bacterial regulatory proteins, gntR family [Lentisphaerae bacterium ADurb.Bin242]
MEKRGYTRFEEVYKRFERFCTLSFQEGCTMLPGERELAEKFGVSRLTLRKAIEMAENSRLIEREGRRAAILPNRTLRSCGEILFITPNSCENVLSPAFERLWLILKPMIENLGGDLKLFVDTPETSMEQFCSVCERAGVILISHLGGGVSSYCRKYEFLRKLRSKKKIIPLSDPYLEAFEYCAALDNRGAGEVAGRALAAAGCRKVLVLGILCYPEWDSEKLKVFGRQHAIFAKRLAGFTDTFPGEIRNYPRVPEGAWDDYIARDMDQIECAYRDGFDGVFIATDENTPRLTAPILSRGIVPERFKIITVHGAGDGMECILPLTSVSHSTGGVAAGAVELLKQFSRGVKPPQPRILVRPELYLNKTIGEVKLCD